MNDDNIFETDDLVILVNPMTGERLDRKVYTINHVAKQDGEYYYTTLEQPFDILHESHFDYFDEQYETTIEEMEQLVTKVFTPKALDSEKPVIGDIVSVTGQKGFYQVVGTNKSALFVQKLFNHFDRTLDVKGKEVHLVARLGTGLAGQVWQQQYVLHIMQTKKLTKAQAVKQIQTNAALDHYNGLLTMFEVTGDVAYQKKAKRLLAALNKGTVPSNLDRYTVYLNQDVGE